MKYVLFIFLHSALGSEPIKQCYPTLDECISGSRRDYDDHGRSPNRRYYSCFPIEAVLPSVICEQPNS